MNSVICARGNRMCYSSASCLAANRCLSHEANARGPASDTSNEAIDVVWFPGQVIRVKDDPNPKDVAGRSKPQLHLIPVGALNSVARVMELGAAKYGPYNWREKKITRTTYLSAAMRHLAAYVDREDEDPESGMLHIDHAIAGLMILRDAIANDTSIDDRPFKPKTGDAK